MHFHKIMKAGISWRVRIVAPHISHVLYVFVYEIVKVHSQADACILDKIKSDLSAQKAHKHSPVCYERFCKNYVLYKNDKFRVSDYPVHTYG